MHPSQTGNLSGLRILIVEDQALVALDLQAVLEEHGAIVVGPCLGLADAMRRTSGGDRLDGAILDVDLGDENVFDLADRLMEGHVPFVFHTGHPDLERLHLRYADVPVLLKPVRAEDVAHELGGVIIAAEARPKVSGR
jgi:DNA-binding LytR/AlgR family response regulator